MQTRFEPSNVDHQEYFLMHILNHDDSHRLPKYSQSKQDSFYSKKIDFCTIH